MIRSRWLFFYPLSYLTLTMELLTAQMAEAEGVTEELKAA